MEREMAAAVSITLTHNERQHTLMITYNTTTHAYIRRTAIFWLDGCVLVMTRAKRMNEEWIWMERNKKTEYAKMHVVQPTKHRSRQYRHGKNSTTKTNDKQRYRPAYYELRKTQHEDGFFEEKQRKASSKYINSVQTWILWRRMCTYIYHLTKDTVSAWEQRHGRFNIIVVVKRLFVVQIDRKTFTWSSVNKQ